MENELQSNAVSIFSDLPKGVGDCANSANGQGTTIGSDLWNSLFLGIHDSIIQVGQTPVPFNPADRASVTWFYDLVGRIAIEATSPTPLTPSFANVSSVYNTNIGSPEVVNGSDFLLPPIILNKATYCPNGSSDFDYNALTLAVQAKVNVDALVGDNGASTNPSQGLVKVSFRVQGGLINGLPFDVGNTASIAAVNTQGYPETYTYDVPWDANDQITIIHEVNSFPSPASVENAFANILVKPLSCAHVRD